MSSHSSFSPITSVYIFVDPTKSNKFSVALETPLLALKVGRNRDNSKPHYRTGRVGSNNKGRGNIWKCAGDGREMKKCSEGDNAKSAEDDKFDGFEI